jgi:hypothetical protein
MGGEYGTRAVDYAFKHFMADAVGSTIAGKPVFVPPEWPKESLLEPVDKSNAPFIETESERHMRWLELRERLNSILRTSRARLVAAPTSWPSM